MSTPTDSKKLLISLIKYSNPDADVAFEDLIISDPIVTEGVTNTQVNLSLASNINDVASFNYNRIVYPDPIVMSPIDPFVSEIKDRKERYITLHVKRMLWETYGIGPNDEHSLVVKSIDMTNDELSIVVLGNEKSYLFAGDITVHVPHHIGSKVDISFYDGENADGVIEPWWFEPNSLEKSFGWEVK